MRAAAREARLAPHSVRASSRPHRGRRVQRAPVVRRGVRSLRLFATRFQSSSRRARRRARSHRFWRQVICTARTAASPRARLDTRALVTLLLAGAKCQPAASETRPCEDLGRDATEASRRRRRSSAPRRPQPLPCSTTMLEASRGARASRTFGETSSRDPFDVAPSPTGHACVVSGTTKAEQAMRRAVRVRRHAADLRRRRARGRSFTDN